MNRLQLLKAALAGSASLVALAQPAVAKLYDIPAGDLSVALVTYIKQSDSALIYADSVVRGHKSGGVRGDLTEIAALTQVLKGTGFAAQTMPSNTIAIVPAPEKPAPSAPKSAQLEVAQTKAPSQPSIETVVVTAQKKTENIQTVPIAVTALSQQQLTERQIAGGPDLVKEVPNLTFSKTNFSGYNLEIRGIGTQAISVTTDPAVAVAFNDIPFIRNHFFEQEFYDLQDVEVLRGPQGTLYGRNATAGVVDLKSALPTDQYEAMLSADMGNYSNRRLEGMLNLPIVGDKLDLRIAGEWTKRDGYSFNTITNQPIDGRDLWSGRVTLGWKPTSDIQAYVVWEHFSEDDDRLRSAKQLCKTDYGPNYVPPAAGNGYGSDYVDGVQKPIYGGGLDFGAGDFFTQGCVPTSLYSPNAFQAPLSFALPYVLGLDILASDFLGNGAPYDNVAQSTNLRDIESEIEPTYRANNNTLEFNVNYSLSPALTLISQTGYNNDFLWSTEDFNRFGSNPGYFTNPYCDPQLGCSTRLIAEDLSEEHAWQLSQEFRVASNFSGPLNFGAGANYLHYETDEFYYVFSNAFTAITSGCASSAGCNDIRGLNSDPNTQNLNRITGQFDNSGHLPFGYQYNNPDGAANISGGYIDPNPITNLNNDGHNYFLSQNPYVLNSYAAFGEVNYDLTNELKLTGGLRWTDDQKHFVDIPSWVVDSGFGYPVAGVVDQQWERFTGRAVANWTPQLDFTDQTLIYASYAHGYKAGGANPPGATYSSRLNVGGYDVSAQPVHPLTFKPEYIEAFELGTKNTLLGGALTVNGDIFYYNYTGYQISEIVDRTAINNNYNAHAEGAELETNWEPLPGLKFGFTGGFEKTGLAGGDEAVDLMDRTAGHPGWFVVKPFVNEASNCIFPAYVAKEIIFPGAGGLGATTTSYCAEAYDLHLDPFTGLPYVPNPTTVLNGTFTIPPGYPGFDPLAGTPGDPYTGQNTSNGIDYGPVPNDGAGFSKKLGGNQLPNAPHFTTSLTAEYTMPVSEDWAATFHTDLYWQSQSWWRVFNDNNYDKLHGYSNVNLSLILTNTSGWQVMGYVKNVFDTTAITGAFLNSDDTGLTTNVFLTDPRLYGVRVTKQLDQNDGFWGSEYSGYDIFSWLLADADNGRPPLWIELGGQLDRVQDPQKAFAPPFFADAPGDVIAPMVDAQKLPLYNFDEYAKATFEPEASDWVLSAAVRYGHANATRHLHYETARQTAPVTENGHPISGFRNNELGDGQGRTGETHLVVDFSAGKDVGLGLFGVTGTSVFSAGVRFAQFASGSDVALRACPTYDVSGVVGIPGRFTLRKHHFHTNTAIIHSKRNTHAIGPEMSWDASQPVTGDGTDMSVALDLGMNAALLFGRQRAQTHHQTAGYYFKGVVPDNPKYNSGTQYVNPPVDHSRARSVIIPNVGGFAGVSFDYRNAKVSFGYRGDFFFNAMDTGWDTHKSSALGFFGPFASISVGLGG